MNCCAVESILDLYREDRCLAWQAAAVAAHLNRCPACKAKARPVARPPRPAALAGIKDRLRLALVAPEGATAPSDAMADRGLPTPVIVLIMFALSLALLHLAAPKIESERLVLKDASPWSLR